MNKDKQIKELEREKYKVEITLIYIILFIMALLLVFIIISSIQRNKLETQLSSCQDDLRETLPSCNGLIEGGWTKISFDFENERYSINGELCNYDLVEIDWSFRVKCGFNSIAADYSSEESYYRAINDYLEKGCKVFK